MGTLTLKKTLPAGKLAALGVKPEPVKPEPVETSPTGPASPPEPPTLSETDRAAMRERLERARALLDDLKARWPASMAACLPLKIGVDKDMRDAMPELSRTELGAALAYHVRNIRYQLALAADGSQRHDLDGKPVEPVSDADRESAAKMVTSIRARLKAAAKRKAKAAGISEKLR